MCYRATSMEENMKSVANAVLWAMSGFAGNQLSYFLVAASCASKSPCDDNVAASVIGFSFPGGTISLFLQVLLLPLQQQQKSKRLRWWHSHSLGQGSIPCGVLLFMVCYIGFYLIRKARNSNKFKWGNWASCVKTFHLSKSLFSPKVG